MNSLEFNTEMIGLLYRLQRRVERNPALLNGVNQGVSAEQIALQSIEDLIVELCAAHIRLRMANE